MALPGRHKLPVHTCHRRAFPFPTSTSIELYAVVTFRHDVHDFVDSLGKGNIQNRCKVSLREAIAWLGNLSD